MICVIGNCQMASLSDALREQTSVFFLNTVSTLTFGATGDIPKELYEKLQGQGLLNVIHQLQNQFPIPGMRDCKPDLIVVNLYHEFDNLFQHNTDGYPLYVQPDLIDYSDVIGEYLDTCFHKIVPSMKGYMNRFMQAIEVIRSLFFEVPILIIKRLSHFKAFGPSPISCLASWEDDWNGSLDSLISLAESLHDCHTLDMDEVFLKQLQNTGESIDRLCPYQYLNFSGITKNGMSAIHFQRDVEHIHNDFWKEVAREVFNFYNTKYIDDPDVKKTQKMYSQEQLSTSGISDSECDSFLSSGDSFTMARALRQFMYNPNKDYSDMLIKYSDKFVFEGAIFQQLYQYSKILKENRILDWLEVMEQRIKKELQDPVTSLFFTRYLRGMEEHVQQNKKMFPDRTFYIEG